jgi:hypothetical protein
VAAVVAPVMAAVVLPAVAAALSSKPAVEAGAADPGEVVGHYSVSAKAARPVPRGSTGGTPVATPAPASSGNNLPIPVAVQATAEGSSTDDSVEAILLEAEQHSADRFMSLAKHQQATTGKVRAAAARKRAATPRKKATP